MMPVSTAKKKQKGSQDSLTAFLYIEIRIGFQLVESRSLGCFFTFFLVMSFTICHNLYPWPVS